MPTDEYLAFQNLCPMANEKAQHQKFQPGLALRLMMESVLGLTSLLFAPPNETGASEYLTRMAEPTQLSSPKQNHL
jgi:hypothetical protein